MYQFAVGMPVRNILYPICFVSGFLLNLRLICGFRQLNRLSQLPGYPQFVRRLDESSEYELPLYLQDRKQAQDMEDLTPATPAVSVPDASSDMPSTNKPQVQQETGYKANGIPLHRLPFLYQMHHRTCHPYLPCRIWNPFRSRMLPLYRIFRRLRSRTSPLYPNQQRR